MVCYLPWSEGEPIEKYYTSVVALLFWDVKPGIGYIKGSRVSRKIQDSNDCHPLRGTTED